MTKKYERDFKIIIPQTEQGVVDDLSVKMSKHFGGVTMMPLVRGLWVDDKQQLVKDDNVLLFSSRDLQSIKGNKEAQLVKDRKFMDMLAKEFGVRLKQDAIWVEEDIVNDIKFVNTKRLREMV